mgnify:CR=1 FL=1
MKNKYRILPTEEYHEGCLTTRDGIIVTAEENSEILFDLVEYHGSVRLSSTLNDGLKTLSLKKIPLDDYLTLKDQISLGELEELELKTDIFVL